MGPGARTAATLAALSALLVGALAWGWSALTEPLPTTPELAICTETSVSEGTKVYPDQVVVNVLNAGRREGLAGRTMQLFVDQGFVAGERANAPQGTEVAVAQIWAADKSNPAVRLVRSRLGQDTPVVDGDAPAPGITVVVGDGFDELQKGKKSALARTDTTVCAAPEGS